MISDYVTISDSQEWKRAIILDIHEGCRVLGPAAKSYTLRFVSIDIVSCHVHRLQLRERSGPRSEDPFLYVGDWVDCWSSRVNDIKQISSNFTDEVLGYVPGKIVKRLIAASDDVPDRYVVSLDPSLILSILKTRLQTYGRSDNCDLVSILDEKIGGGDLSLWEEMFCCKCFIGPCTRSVSSKCTSQSITDKMLKKGEASKTVAFMSSEQDQVSFTNINEDEKDDSKEIAVDKSPEESPRDSNANARTSKFCRTDTSSTSPDKHAIYAVASGDDDLFPDRQDDDEDDDLLNDQFRFHGF